MKTPPHLAILPRAGGVVLRREISQTYAQRLSLSRERPTHGKRQILFQRVSGFLDLQGFAGQPHNKSPHRNQRGARLATWCNRASSKALIWVADPCRVSRAAERGALFAQGGHRPHQIALSTICQCSVRSGGRRMNAASIRRLCRRYALTEVQARLIWALHFGGKHD